MHPCWIKESISSKKNKILLTFQMFELQNVLISGVKISALMQEIIFFRLTR